MLRTLDNIILEMKMIQLQLYLAKRTTTRYKSSKTILLEVESHINHSLHSLSHLITQIDAFKIIAESKYSASNRIKEDL